MRYVLIALLLATFGFAGSAHASSIGFDFGKGDKFDFDKGDKGKKTSYGWDGRDDDFGWSDKDKKGDKDKDHWNFDRDDKHHKGKDRDDWGWGDPKGHGGYTCDPGDPGSPTPLPGSVLMFAPALLGMTAYAMRRRLKAKKA